MSTPLSFCAVIPMYNEELGAEKCVRSVYRGLEQLPYRTALIVVNDASRDCTGDILARLALEFKRLIILTHQENRGYGGGLKTGARQAAEMGFDYVLFMDSDLTNDPSLLPLFVEKMLAGCDVIKASRYMRGGGVVGVPLWKVLISAVGNWLARYLYGLPIWDCTNGFRALRTNILRQMRLQENGFAIIMEELYQAKFLAKSFCEVPYILGARTKADKPSSFVYHPQVFFNYLKYPLKSFLGDAPLHLSQRKS